MTRSTEERSDDILAAIARCQAYRDYLASQDDTIAAMAFDAILRNLAVIGEAVRALPEQTTSARPEIPWVSIAGLRNIVVHEYFRVDHAAIVDIVDTHLARLRSALTA